MIRIEHRPLPAGLGAIARRETHHILTITVSTSLDAAAQRSAVRVALRAARRHDWRSALVPLPLLLFPGVLRSLVSKLGHVLHLHGVATALAAGSVVAVAATGLVVIGAVHTPGGVNAARPPTPSYQPSPAAGQPGTGNSPSSSSPRNASPSHVGPVKPPVVVVTSPGTNPRPSASASTPGTQGQSAQPSPSSTTSAPQPTPTPSPTAHHGGGTCIKILGLVVCL